MDNVFSLALNLIIYVPIILIFSIMPFIARKDLVFGVTVPKSEWKNEYFTKQRKYFMLSIICSGVIFVAADITSLLLLPEKTSVIFTQVFIWAVILVYFMLYLFFWKKTKKYKENAGWKIETQNIVAADTSTEYKKRSLSSAWFLFYLVIIAVSFYSAMQLYNLAPNMIPMRFDLQGNPISYAPKSMKLIYMIIGMQVFMGLLFFAINLMIRRAKKNIDPDNPEKSSERSDIMKFRWSIFLYITGLLMLLIFTQIVFAMFTQMPTWITMFFPIIGVFIILIYAIVLSIKTGQSGSRIMQGEDTNISSAITKDDDAAWKLGTFYYNKDDPALFVEKRFGPGWTVNWAKWQSWLFVAVILAVVAVSIIISL
ncbi:MAG: DUF5808 domain-containing protein [Eubacteriales bacterium]